MSDNATQQRPSHEAMQKLIRAARDVSDFEIAFNRTDYMMERTHQAQIAHGGGRWDWCVQWAVARYHQEAWTDVFELDRKTCLLLLECLYRHYEPDKEDPSDFKTLHALDVCKEFGTDKIDRILTIFLPMDKANAFYKMTAPGQVHPGLSWYCKLHTVQELTEHGVTPNENGKGPLNRRYVQLVQLANQYLTERGLPRIGKHWEQYLQPDMPPTAAS